MTNLESRRAHDLADFCQSMLERQAQRTADFCIRIMEQTMNRANAFGTGLGGPEGPEPDKPSPHFVRHPISQGEKK